MYRCSVSCHTRPHHWSRSGRARGGGGGFGFLAGGAWPAAPPLGGAFTGCSDRGSAPGAGAALAAWPLEDWAAAPGAVLSSAGSPALGDMWPRAVSTSLTPVGGMSGSPSGEHSRQHSRSWSQWAGTAAGHRQAAGTAAAGIAPPTPRRRSCPLRMASRSPRLPPPSWPQGGPSLLFTSASALLRVASSLSGAPLRTTSSAANAASLVNSSARLIAKGGAAHAMRLVRAARGRNAAMVARARPGPTAALTDRCKEG